MASIERPELVAPWEPTLPSAEVDSDKFPVWEPTVERPRPPPLPVPSTRPPPRAITPKHYRQLSHLPAAFAAAAAAEPQLMQPVDLPAVGRFIARRTQRHGSDSDGVVTSPAAAAGGNADAELETLLEETLLEEDEEEETEGVAPFPEAVTANGAGGRKTRSRKPATAIAAAAAEEPLPAAPTELPREEATEIEADEAQTSEKEEEEEGPPQAAADRSLVERSITNQSVLAAVQACGFDSWDAAIAHITAAAAVVDAAGGGRARRGGRGKHGAVPSLAEILNPKSHFYHSAFSKAYRRKQAQLQRQEREKRKAAALEEHSALLDGRYSALTAAEHTWYLQREGQQLVGSDAERFAALRARVEEERLEYWAAVEANAAAQRGRYEHLTDRQAAQLEADFKRRKQRAMDMPQYWAFHALIPSSSGERTATILAARAGGASEQLGRILAVERELRTCGQAPTLQSLAPGTRLPGHKEYLPAVESGGGGGASGSTAGTAAAGVYRKVGTAEVWEDSEMRAAAAELSDTAAAAAAVNTSVCCAAAGAMLCLLRSFLLEGVTSAFEIPVSVEEEGAEQRRLIFLGKPLLARKMALREKQRRLQRYAVLSAAVHSSDGEGRRALAPRQAVYWQASSVLDGSALPLTIRSHSRAMMLGVGEKDEERNDSAFSLPAALAVSTEYLPEPDMEESTLDELVSWWAKLLLTPGAETIAVAHVNVPHSSVAAWRTVTLAEVVEGCEGRIDAGAGARGLATTLSALQSLPPGKYILSSQGGPGSKGMCLYMEAGADFEVAAPAAAVLPLPLGAPSTSAAAGDNQVVYDLHAAHARAGEVDTAADPFVAPRWRPFRDDIAQIPFTFPPHTGGRKDQRMRRRQRTVRHVDMDQVQHIAHISRREYEAGLLEEL